jgi:hypothetical protein
MTAAAEQGADATPPLATAAEFVEVQDNVVPTFTAMLFALFVPEEVCAPPAVAGECTASPTGGSAASLTLTAAQRCSSTKNLLQRTQHNHQTIKDK